METGKASVKGGLGKRDKKLYIVVGIMLLINAETGDKTGDRSGVKREKNESKTEP